MEDLVTQYTIHKWVEVYYILYGSGIYTAKHLQPLPQYMDQDTAEVDLCTYR